MTLKTFENRALLRWLLLWSGPGAAPHDNVPDGRGQIDGLPDHLRKDVGLPDRETRPPPIALQTWRQPWHL